MTARRFTVVLADDHAFTVSGMQRILDQHGMFEVVGVASNGIEAIARIKAHRPDCAVLDYSMPGATGLEVLFETRRWSPDTRIAVVTGNLAPGLIRELRVAGVDGLFAKTTAPDLICSGLLAVAEGANRMCDTIAGIVEALGQAEALTARELEVLQGVSRGLSNPQISEHLGISVKTVDSHRTSLMRKLGVRSTAALLVRAMKDGLIDISDAGG